MGVCLFNWCLCDGLGYLMVLVTIMHSFVCYFSTLEQDGTKQIMNNQNSQTKLIWVHECMQARMHPWTGMHVHTHTNTHTHAHSVGELEGVRFERSRIWECFWWPNFARARVPDSCCSTHKKELWPSKCMHTERRQRVEVSEEEYSWYVCLQILRSLVNWPGAIELS